MKFWFKISPYIFIMLIPFLWIGAHAEPILIDRIIAVVDKEIITLSDVLMQEDLLYMRDTPSSNPTDDSRLKNRESILQDLINRELLLKEAKRLNLIPTETEISEQIEHLKTENQIFSDKDFESLLEKEGLTVEVLKKKISEDIAFMRIRQQIAYDLIEVTEQEIKDYYNNEWKGERENPRVRLAHILVKYPEESDQGQEEALLNRCTEIIKAWEHGEAFSKLAERFSEDDSARYGGALGTFYLEDLRPEFFQAIQEVEVGQITGPVKTELGYHILFLEERKTSELEKDSPLWNTLKEYLLKKKGESVYEKWIERLKKGSTIEIHEEALKWKL